MKYSDKSIKNLAQIQAQLSPLNAVYDDSFARSIVEKINPRSATQKILEEMDRLKESLFGNGAYAAQLALKDGLAEYAMAKEAESVRAALGHSMYASELTSLKHALGAPSGVQLARQFADSLRAESPYINELAKMQKMLAGEVAASSVQLQAGLKATTAANHAKEIFLSHTAATEASIRALQDEMSGRISALQIDAQRPHVLMDAFQRATTWLNPFEDIQRSVALRETAKYSALYAVADPMQLFLDTVGAATRNPFGAFTNESTIRIIESLRSFGIDHIQNVVDDDDVEVTEEDLVPYTSIAQSQLANHVTLSADSIEALVSALMAAYQNLPTVRDRKIFQTYFYPILVSLVFALINPYFDFLIKQKLEASKPTTEKVVQQVARDSGAPAYVLETFRFVTAATLTVRVNGKMKSPSIASLRFGQPVEIVRKEGDWTLIRYSDADNEVEIQGWVLSRYLKKFQ